MKSAVFFCATAGLTALQGSIAQTTTTHSLPWWVTDPPLLEPPSTTTTPSVTPSVTDYVILESQVCGMPCLGCVVFTMTVPNPGVVTAPITCLYGTTTITQSWPAPGFTPSTEDIPFSPSTETHPVLAATVVSDGNKRLAVETSGPFAWSETAGSSYVVTTTVSSTTTEGSVVKVSVLITTTNSVHAWSGSITANATTTTTSATATGGAGTTYAVKSAVVALMVGLSVMLALF